MQEDVIMLGYLVEGGCCNQLVWLCCVTWWHRVRRGGVLRWHWSHHWPDHAAHHWHGLTSHQGSASDTRTPSLPSSCSASLPFLHLELHTMTIMSLQVVWLLTKHFPWGTIAMPRRITIYIHTMVMEKNNIPDKNRWPLPLSRLCITGSSIMQ